MRHVGDNRRLSRRLVSTKTNRSAATGTEDIRTDHRRSNLNDWRTCDWLQRYITEEKRICVERVCVFAGSGLPCSERGNVSSQEANSTLRTRYIVIVPVDSAVCCA